MRKISKNILRPNKKKRPLERPESEHFLMGSISKKQLKVNNNLTCNLIKYSRIVLDTLEEWRALFSILELLRLRGYSVDEFGSIQTTFKELHKIYSSGLSKNITKEETARAFEALAARRFNLEFDDITKTDSPLIIFENDLKSISEIQINEIFYHNIHSFYLSVPLQPLKILTAAARKVKGRARLNQTDILLFLYALQIKNHTRRGSVCLSVEGKAERFGLSKLVDDRHTDRARAALEHSAAMLKTIGFIVGFHFKGNSLVLTFKRKKQVLSGRNLSEARSNNYQLSKRQDL